MLTASIERMKQEIRENTLREMGNKIRIDVQKEMGNKIIEIKIETKIETAKKMIEKGLSLNLISECLDLSEDEIRKLLQ